MPKKVSIRKRSPWSFYNSTAHIGSKRGFMRLRLVSGKDGKGHVIWPKRKRRGRQVAPMGTGRRWINYLRQNDGGPLKPGQERRLAKKQRRAVH